MPRETLAKPQIRLSLGTIEVTDTERRAVAWMLAADIGTDRAATRGTFASRETVRSFIRLNGIRGLQGAVERFLDAGGQTASMKARVI